MTLTTTAQGLRALRVDVKPKRKGCLRPTWRRFYIEDAMTQEGISAAEVMPREASTGRAALTQIGAL